MYKYIYKYLSLSLFLSLPLSLSLSHSLSFSLSLCLSLSLSLSLSLPASLSLCLPFSLLLFLSVFSLCISLSHCVYIPPVCILIFAITANCSWIQAWLGGLDRATGLDWIHLDSLRLSRTHLDPFELTWASRTELDALGYGRNHLVLIESDRGHLDALGPTRTFRCTWTSAG